MIIYYEVHTLQGVKKLCCEIQIRTLAMNFWATVEHSLQYKYKKNIPDAEAEQLARELVECAQTSAALDSHMQDIKNRIATEEEKHSKEEPKTIGDIILKNGLFNF